MNSKINKIKNFRIYLLKQVQSLSTAQLNHIPSGFKNNVAWNLGHLVAATQNICYVRAGLPVTIEDKFFTPYVSGTKPEKYIDDQEIKMVSELLLTTLDRLDEDLLKNKFINYSPSPAILKVYGFEVNTIEDALEYVLYHDGYHAGCITVLKSIVHNQQA